jgi:exopolysaccharide biosynthesis protein
MASRKLFIRIFCFLLGCWTATGCGTMDPIDTQTPTLTSTSVPVLSPTATQNPDTGWFDLQPSLERRTLKFMDDQNQWVEALNIFRLDPNQFRFDVAYHRTPQSLRDWQAETDALIVVNGGYFRIENDEYIPNGLTIADGEVIGISYGTFAGMLAITRDGPELRWLEQEPYNPDEGLLAALQSFPIIVKPGGKLGLSEEHEDHQKAARTVIGQDTHGRILFMIAPEGYFTLQGLSATLTESDLELDIAINLDGGPSSGILVADPPEEISRGALLPVVILVFDR